MKKLLLVFALVFVLLGCASEKAEAVDQSEEIRFTWERCTENVTIGGNTYIITDNETGVKYLFVHSGYSGGLTVLQEGAVDHGGE